jgi:hypothetical protein
MSGTDGLNLKRGLNKNKILNCLNRRYDFLLDDGESFAIATTSFFRLEETIAFKASAVVKPLIPILTPVDPYLYIHPASQLPS